MSIELTPLGTLTIVVDSHVRLEGVPAGTRVVGTASEASFEGERLRATELLAPASDWVTVHGDGTGSVDARLLLRTDDGARILMRYGGRIAYRGDEGASVVIAPTFETDDGRYAWLNAVQAVGKGERVGKRLVYEVHAVV
ncbi:MAG: DUF3237 domain-containing protein [Acidimicrobiales bacterium]